MIKNLIVSILLIVLTGCTSQENEVPKDLSGVWTTPTTVPYIIEYTKELPQGKKIIENGIEFVERQVKLTWTLHHKPNGLISGVNEYIIYDTDGSIVMKASEPIVGVVHGTRISLIEGKKINSPQVHFDCTAEEANKLNCFGFDVGGIRPFAIHFVLEKKS